MYCLLKIKGRYYFNMRVPKDLVPVLKARIIKRALHTNSYRNGKVIAQSLGARLGDTFALWRSGALTDEQTQQMLEDFKNDTLRCLDGNRTLGICVPKKPDGYEQDELSPLEELTDLLSMLTADMREDLAHSNYKPYEKGIDDLLKGKGYKLDKDSLEYKRACRGYLRGLIYINEIEIERTLGNHDNQHDNGTMHHTLFQSSPATRERNTGSPARTEEDAGASKSMPLSEAIELFIKSKSPNWQPKTKQENEHMLSLALEVLGDRNIYTLSKSALLDYREKVMRLPPNYNKKPDYKGKSLPEVLEMLKASPLKPISNKTLNKNLHGVSSLFKWLIEEARLPLVNYASNLEIKTKKKAIHNRKPYDKEDLQRLFESPIYTTDIPVERPERFWIPLIGLFTGARLNEICSLYLKDIYEDDGILCFSITEDAEDQHVKSDESVRTVPVHPTLIKAGILSYAATLKEKGEERLFPNLTYTIGNRYGGAMSKWYGRINRLYITKDPLKVFHSFRHTLNDNLKQQLVPISVIEAIEGQKGEESMGKTVYGSEYSVKVKHETLLRLDYSISFDGIKWPMATAHTK